MNRPVPRWFSALFLSVGCASPPAVDSRVRLELPEVQGANGQSCGRALAVLHTDYASTSVSLLSFTGKVLTAPRISSGSRDVILNAPLGGDVVLPSARSPELVLIDRYPTSVLTFVNPETGEVRGQLDVGLGFASNPQDYLELSESLALVSRFDPNPRSSEGETEGSDLLWVDPVRREVLGRLDLSALENTDGATRYFARPGHLLKIGSTVLVALSMYDQKFSTTSQGRLLLLHDAVSGGPTLDTFDLPELKNCSSLALSPAGTQVAITCSGLVNNANSKTPEFSGLILLEVLQTAGRLTLRERSRVRAQDLGRGPFAFGLAFASETELLAMTFGALEGEDAGRPDALLLFDTTDLTASPRELVRSRTEAFSLGQIVCQPACSVCFLADAGRNAVQRFDLDTDKPFEPVLIPIDDGIGLPPRSFGWL